MDDKDHLAAMLPEPPPPAPARREQAIDAALRRFDGQTDAAPRPSPAKPAAWRAAVTGPRLGAAITVALVAMIGLPMALRETDHQQVGTYRTPAPVAQSAPAEQLTPAVIPPTSRSAPPLSPSVPPPSLSAPPPSQPSPSPVAEPVVAEAESAADRDAVAISAAPPPPPAAKDRQMAIAERARAEPGLAKTSEAGRLGAFAMRKAEARFPASSSLAAPSPPPPPTVAGAAARQDAMVAAGLRANEATGAADDCTINDPRRNLLLCKAVINPAAPGVGGQAAAHVADGLSNAWAGELDKAIDELDKAIAIAPRLGIAYLNRGLIRARMGDADRAIADADKAVRYAPNAQNYRNRARIWDRMGRRTKARADEAKATALDPDRDARLPDQR